MAACIIYKPIYVGDPYIIDSTHGDILKKINDAKIGKLIVNGNYQIASVVIRLR